MSSTAFWRAAARLSFELGVWGDKILYMGARQLFTLSWMAMERRDEIVVLEGASGM